MITVNNNEVKDFDSSENYSSEQKGELMNYDFLATKLLADP